MELEMINTEAFEQLNRVLLKIDDDGLPFTLEDWCVETAVRQGWWLWTKEIGCQTAFCVMGWAAQDPWFITRGFRLSNEDRDLPVVFFKGKTGWDAVTAFLGITEDEALFLFDEPNYGRAATPSEVSIRCEAFLQGKLKEALEYQPCAESNSEVVSCQS
jgi:hypothetical protein